MNKSENISDLLTSFAKFQAVVEQPTKNKEVRYGNTKFKYADLAQCMECARKPLSANGLSVIQMIEDNGSITTMLSHSSGQWLSATFGMPLAGKPQDYGSAITYLKRYSYCAILGIVADDDDDAQMAASLQKSIPAASQSAPAQHSSAADVQLAISELCGAATMQDLQKTWAKWKIVQTIKEVQVAKDTRKNQLTEHSNGTVNQ